MLFVALMPIQPGDGPADNVVIPFALRADHRFAREIDSLHGRAAETQSLAVDCRARTSY